MPRLLLAIGLRLLACAAASYVLWRWLGAVGIVVTAPLFGVALARPLIELASACRAAMRHLALSGLEGRHYEHRGCALDIAEDEFHQRWISVADIRKLIAGLPREAVLQRQFPQALRDDATLGGPRISADALLVYLEKSTDADSLKFRNWLKREVIFPAAQVRQRLGLGDAGPPWQSRPDDAP